jgi:hypothetical protein
MEAILAIVALGLTPRSSATPVLPQDNGTRMVYSFDDIQQSKELVWTPCWDNHTCAMLEVQCSMSIMTPVTLTRLGTSRLL